MPEAPRLVDVPWDISIHLRRIPLFCSLVEIHSTYVDAEHSLEWVKAAAERPKPRILSEALH
jgi:hypothetical protein